MDGRSVLRELAASLVFLRLADPLSVEEWSGKCA